MSPGYWFAVTICAILLVTLVVLLRRRRLKEKYAALWFTLAVGVCVIGAIPPLAGWLSRLVGVETPSNLLFAAAIFVLLLVCIQLSLEVSSLEESARTVAEEHALLRQECEELRDEMRALGRAARAGPNGAGGPA
ncbi:DUF2304 domain-containing protein [Xylanimonas ulmi]|uniref:DUF2304 domain-containing protein n=1 Tax=Xylanimonas ulmi TaxID=228973 RepID=A0A4Q7M232_9MICO|nr:DUF2304 domain-containing protein [Xylanibacterium ulmi]RZS59969.1 hypothetical protein EV386_0209 [Xylanibacterium ulmi]